MSILATTPDLKKIIKKAVERIGENHALARDNNGVTITNKDIQHEREEMSQVIEESLKDVAEEMAEKMVLENTIDGMVKDVISENKTSVGTEMASQGSGFVHNQNQSSRLQEFSKRQEMGEQRPPWPPSATPEQTRDLKRIKACVNTIEGYEYTRKGRSPYVGGTFMTEFMWHLKESFDKNAENAKEIEYKIKQCFRNTVFWDEYGKALRFLGDDRNFRRIMKDLERGPIEESRINEQENFWDVVTYLPKKIKKFFTSKSGEQKMKEALALAKKQCEKQGGTWGSEKSGPCKYCCDKRGNSVNLDKRNELQKTLQALINKIEKGNVNETTVDLIKKIVKKKLEDKTKLKEATTTKVPGYEAFEKAHRESSKINKEAEKNTKKKFDEYADFKGNTKPKFLHQEGSKTNPDGGYEYYRNTDDDQEFVDDFAYPGLQDFDVNNQNMERLADYLEGSQETGNAQTDEDDEALGNVVPSDLGEKILKSKKRRKEKIAKEKASMTNLRGITPDVQKVTQIKEEVKEDINQMKKMWDYNEISQ